MFRPAFLISLGHRWGHRPRLDASGIDSSGFRILDVMPRRDLPDSLGQRAKDAGLNLSRLLRDAVERELCGEAAAPAVAVERVGTSVEVRISVPADDLREKLS